MAAAHSASMQQALTQAVMCVLPRSLAEIVAEFAVPAVRTGVAFMGHVDSGKSTLAGHLVNLLGKVSRDKMEEVSRIAVNYGKGSFKYAYLFDKTMAERERGISIEFSSLSVESPTGCKYDLIDLPGHPDYMSNAIRGAALANVLVAVAAIPPGEFEANTYTQDQMGSNWEGGLRTAIKVAICQGIDDLVFVCNKMDAIYFKQEQYENAKTVIKDIVRQMGCKFEPSFVPVSAWTGDNLVSRSSKMPWYKGPCLMELLDNLNVVKMRKYHPGPLRVIGLRLGYFDKRRIIATRVLAGTVLSGDVLTVLQKQDGPNRAQCRNLPSTAPLGGTHRNPVSVLDLHIAEQPAVMAGQGDLVALKISTTPGEEFSKGGLIFGPLNDPPLLSVRMIANLLITRSRFTRGGIGKYSPIMHVNVFETEARWHRLIAILPNKASLSPSRDSTTTATTPTETTEFVDELQLTRGMVVTVEIVMPRGVYIGPEHPNRCLFRDQRTPVALGKILAHQVVCGETVEWREPSGNVISNIGEWESRLPFFRVYNANAVALARKPNQKSDMQKSKRH